MTGNDLWEPGEWTDDTAMALCLAESIIERGLLDTSDVAFRYVAWSESKPKDIGLITRTALWGTRSDADARQKAEAYHAESGGRTAGNGTVMRCAPIALAAYSLEEATFAARQDAALTHFDPAAGDASAALCAALLATGTGADPLAAAQDEIGDHQKLVSVLDAVRNKNEGELSHFAAGGESGTCWTTLGVALFALLSIDDYERGVQWAISLGGDTDTNAAVAGALLGCRDGAAVIPERWLSVLHERERIEGLADRLAVRR